MKTRSRFIGIAMLLTMVSTSEAFALWGRYPNDKPVKADGWPKEIVKAINSCKRVFGAGAYDAGWSFYFIGNTDEFNGFLATMAAENGVPLSVVLMPEPGVANPDPSHQDHKIDYSWSLHLYPYRDTMGWRPMDRKAGESDAQYEKRRNEEVTKLPEYGVDVRVHCTGTIDLAKIQIPLAFTASVGGRLSNFANYHNEQRNTRERQGKPEADAFPTNMQAAEAPRALFGPGTTQPASQNK